MTVATYFTWAAIFLFCHLVYFFIRYPTVKAAEEAWEQELTEIEQLITEIEKRQDETQKTINMEGFDEK